MANEIKIKDMKGMVFDSPAAILNQMKSFQTLAVEATPEEKIEIQLSQFALAKAFYDMLCESFNCGSKVTEEVLKELPSNTGLTLTVNGVPYTGTNEHVETAEVDKAWLKAQGYKTQLELYNDYKAKGKPLPAGLYVQEKVIVSFKDTLWDGTHPIGVASEFDVQKIEIGKKKSK